MSDGGEGAWRTGYYQGKKDEQQRIIELLVSVFDKPWSVSSREELEAFIQGEK